MSEGRKAFPATGELEQSDAYSAFADRHNVRAAPYLTVTDPETAVLIAERLCRRIEAKTVVEVGGGIGLLSLAMGAVAKRVYCIEANPMWSFTFAQLLLQKKPKNVSFLLGAADEFIGCIKADVAVFCSHSDVSGMMLLGKQFAPTVLDVCGEMIEANPEAFDPVARRARSFA